MLMLAWVLFVADFVKKLVHERELRLHEVMLSLSPQKEKKKERSKLVTVFDNMSCNNTFFSFSLQSKKKKRKEKVFVLIGRSSHHTVLNTAKK